MALCDRSITLTPKLFSSVFRGNFDLVVVFVAASAIPEEDWVNRLEVGELRLIF